MSLILTSPYKPQRVIRILKEEVDNYPSLLRCLLTLNAHYFSGTSPVRGVVGETSFELRNRSGPGFSLRARGTLTETGRGTEIKIEFSRPSFPDLIGLIFDRYENDRVRMVEFLRDRLKAEEKQPD